MRLLNIRWECDDANRQTVTGRFCSVRMGLRGSALHVFVIVSPRRQTSADGGHPSSLLPVFVADPPQGQWHPACQWKRRAYHLYGHSQTHVILKTMGQDGLQLFGGGWTERKLDALHKYLRAYAKALSNTAFNRVYIDAFAGTGYREQRISARVQPLPDIFADELGELHAPEPQHFLDGSAKIALKVEPPFHRFIFIENDDAKVQELERLKAEFPPQASAIDIRAGDANKTIQDICTNWDNRETRGVLFLDPFGMQVDWATIDAVAKTRCIDTWILFPFAANRLMTKSPNDIPQSWRARLEKLFGTSDWEQRFYKKHTLRDIFDGDMTVVQKALTLEGLGAYYGERLRTVFPVVAPNPRILCSESNRPLFQLFFAAANPGKGGAIALNIAKHILENI